MTLTPREVTHVARLARLRIGDDEIAGVTAKLDRILAFVDQLKAADTAGLAPMAHPLDMTQRLRADEVTETDRRDDYQRNAPETVDGLYIVPRVIE